MDDTPLGIEKETYDFTSPSPARKAVFKKGITMTLENHHGGYHIVFSNGKETLSAIFTMGSYGREMGLWEIMPPNPPKSWGDYVKGYLTFEEVLKWVKKQL